MRWNRGILSWNSEQIQQLVGSAVFHSNRWNVPLRPIKWCRCLGFRLDCRFSLWILLVDNLDGQVFFSIIFGIWLLSLILEECLSVSHSFFHFWPCVAVALFFVFKMMLFVLVKILCHPGQSNSKCKSWMRGEASSGYWNKCSCLLDSTWRCWWCVRGVREWNPINILIATKTNHRNWASPHYTLQ